MATRYNINDFALGNPAYVGATVSFWTVSGGAKTTTLATLYAASTGTTTLANPRTLDSDGKFSVPVYVEVPVIATVSGLTVADHDTGIMGLAEGAASTSAAAAAVSAAAALVSENNAETAETNSAASAAAALVSENNAAATLAGALLKAGDNMTGGINSARGNITQHATTMDLFAVTSPDILDGTGSAVTITACVNAPQAGATRKFYPIVATVLTHGATFDIAGNANLTAAAGDCWIIEAKTASTYRVTAVKEDGTAVVGFNASAVAGIGNGRATDITISSVGEVTMPLQPAFLAYRSSTAANATGDNFPVDVVCDTEVFDQGGDYDNGTGVFTAPVAGRYRFTAHVLLTGLAAAHAIQEMYIITSNRAYSIQDIFAAGANPFVTQRVISISVLAEMDAGDTAKANVNVLSGSRVVGIYGSGLGNYTFFCGELVA